MGFPYNPLMAVSLTAVRKFHEGVTDAYYAPSLNERRKAAKPPELEMQSLSGGAKKRGKLWNLVRRRQ